VLHEVSEAARLASTRTEPLINRSPIREIIFAVRAIMPLCAALVLLLVVVLRIPLPVSHFDSSIDAAEEEEQRQQRQRRQQLLEVLQQPAEQGTLSHSELSCTASEEEIHAQPAGEACMADALSTILVPGDLGQAASQQSAAAKVPEGGAAADASVQGTDAIKGGVHITSSYAGEQRVSAEASASACAAAGSSTGGCCVWLRQHSALLCGMLFCQVGMILFNLGLSYGFTALGDMTGTWLPSSFLKLPYAPGSPYYSVAGKRPECTVNFNLGAK
jgi:hypothetical protein